MLCKLEDQGKTAIIVTVVSTTGSTPRKPGARMIIEPNGTLLWGTIGGGAVEHQIQQKASEILESGPQLITLSVGSETGEETGMICGGEMTIYAEPYGSLDRLFIIGGGHIGQILARMAVGLDFQIIIVDERQEMALPANYPLESQIITGKPLFDLISELKTTDDSYIVILTHSHTSDSQTLEICLQKPHRYLGMIGSQRKVNEVFEELRGKGISHSILESVRSPIGLPIGSETPGEIAISILAELVKFRRKPGG